MAFDQSLARRVRHLFAQHRGMTEKRMFGGVGFLMHGNMCVGIWKSSLIARIGPNAAPSALAEPFVGEFDVTGRPMRGWVMIEPDGIESDEQLRRWIQMSCVFVETLPKKK